MLLAEALAESRDSSAYPFLKALLLIARDIDRSMLLSLDSFAAIFREGSGLTR